MESYRTGRGPHKDCKLLLKNKNYYGVTVCRMPRGDCQSCPISQILGKNPKMNESELEMAYEKATKEKE